MSKAKLIVSAIALCAAVGVSAFAQAPTTKPAPKSTPAKAKAPVKTDAEIQSCIEQKLGAAPKLKDDHFAVTVSGGAATFTGATKAGSNKGGVDSIAKSCGAHKVVNNITVEKAPAATKPKK